MSQKNVECSEHVWDLFMAGDTVELLAFLDLNVEVHDPPNMPDAGVYHGHAGWQTQRDRFDEAFTNLTYKRLECIDCGEHAVSVIHVSGTATSSGVPGNVTYAQVETWHDGKIVAIRYFVSKEDALEAVGLGAE